jgi:S-adenosylmethionine decarboxylase
MAVGRFCLIFLGIYFIMSGRRSLRRVPVGSMKGRVVRLEEKLKLYGFNNLTKALSFNIYDICYAKSQREQQDYIKYIDSQYNSERLTKILSRVTEMIGAKILNIAKQDYDPQGASVTLLIAEEAATAKGAVRGMKPPMRDTILAHLDKSHVTVHTYPEYHPDTSIATFRVDIDVATCGAITPLKTLDYLISNFDSDIITMDYRVRGFTRDITGRKLFMDHKMTSIQDYIKQETLEAYDAVDINVYQANLFHTRMLIKELDLKNYLFNTDIYEIAPKTRLAIHDSLRREMIEIFSGQNVY